MKHNHELTYIFRTSGVELRLKLEHVENPVIVIVPWSEVTMDEKHILFNFDVTFHWNGGRDSRYYGLRDESFSIRRIDRSKWVKAKVEDTSE